MRIKRKKQPGKPSIKFVQRQFKIWRGKRKGRDPIPERLWLLAVQLTEDVSVNQICQVLGLNHTALSAWVSKNARRKKQGPEAPRRFVEVDWSQRISAATVGVCELELEDSRGRKLRLRGERPGELIEAIRSFWELSS